MCPSDDGGSAGAAVDERRHQRQAWDRVGESMPDLLPTFSTRYYRRCEIALIRRAVGPLAGKRVLKLDLWNEAFNTRILNWMRAQGAETYGLDLAEITLRRARHNALRDGGPLQLVQSDIREIAFRDASFDFVYTMGTIEHIDEYQQAVGEIARVLRPGGRAIIGVPRKWDLFLRPVLVSVLSRFGKYPYSPEKSFGCAELTRVVAHAGLRVRDRTGLLAFPGIVRMAELFLFHRGIPLHHGAAVLLSPFALIEPRWQWTGRFGYLVALVVEKPS